MEIQIPSPSVFLRKSPVVSAAVPPPKGKSVKPRGTVKKIHDPHALNKTKQTKSRNGCGTCKKKRLKCDEAKPCCAQCQKRNVTCEGYKKEYKWRDFKESTFQSKPTTTAKRARSKDGKWSPTLDSAFASASNAFQDGTKPNLTNLTPSEEFMLDRSDTAFVDVDLHPPTIDLPSPGSTFDLDGSTGPSMIDLASSRSSTFSDAIVALEPSPPQNEVASTEVPSLDEEPADEEIVRDPVWAETGSLPIRSDMVAADVPSPLVLHTSPRLDLASPEMLLARFVQQTCGILSVKDGPTENPWRTLIWPLAQDSEALYHAISSMTAFHGAYDVPQLRVAGMAHMTKSIRNLAAEIENMRPDVALATSLVLALGEGWDEKISTGIQHLRGARIMVNNALVKHRHEAHSGRAVSQDAVRLRFLCNTFVYLDVIARLTSLDEPHHLNLDDLLTTVNPHTGDLVEVDPLMGCASTLFPLIGQVADLIQRVRRSTSNSLTFVSQAMDLKQKLIHWQTPSHFAIERPEDPTSEVQHAIQTAEAYRFATLLYLHQAVPEIPSETAETLAKKVLVLLASVPLSSRTNIVQIFPLFAASCEVNTEEDRNWVLERWAAMISRLHIGNVDYCWRVVQEVWHRRDAFEQEKAQRLMRRYTSRGLSNGSMMADMPLLTRRLTASDLPFDQMEAEYTVRGNLHWIGVMADWNWEVFLG